MKHVEYQAWPPFYAFSLYVLCKECSCFSWCNVLYFSDYQVVNQVLEGEGIGWLKLNRLKKLMEDESYRNFVVSKLNRTLDRKISPDDHIDDVVSRPVM